MGGAVMLVVYYTCTDGDWNFYFCSVYTARSLFNVESGFRLTDNQ